MKPALPAGTAQAQPITIGHWQSLSHFSIKGTFTANLGSGLSLHLLTLHHRDGRWWITAPSMPLLSRDEVLRDADGRIRYSAVVSFRSVAIRARFDEACIAALRIAVPEVFVAAEEARA